MTSSTQDGMVLETFEDGPALSFQDHPANATVGRIETPSPSTDSVFCDLPGPLAAAWSSGRSWYIAQGGTVTFSFSGLSPLPTRAGIVWTGYDGWVTFEAFDAIGNALGPIGPDSLGNWDGLDDGATGEDRFFGVEYLLGISAITISSTNGSMEVDHLQFGQD